MKLLKLALLASLFLLATAILLREIGIDSDIWLHLKTGQLILQNHLIPAKDIFSATTQQAKWINHEWLFQVIIFIFYNFFGSGGVIFLRWLVVILTLLVLIKAGYNKNNYFSAGFFSFVFLMLIQTRLNDRPELVSILFIVLFLYLLEKKIDSPAIWLLVPLQVLWVNIHAYFLFGIFITAAYLLENIIKKSNVKRTALLFFAIIFISLINPHGLEGLFYPVKLAIGIKTNLKIFTYYINELLGPFSIPQKGPVATSLIWYKSLILISAVLFLINIKRIRISHLVLYSGMLIISLASLRNIPIFGLVACITAIYNTKDIKLKKGIEVPFGILFIFSMGILFFNEVSSVYYVYDKGKFKSRLFGVSPIRYPKEACSFMKENKIKGNVLNNFYCGSYIIWRLYPDIKVSIDGRVGEIYSPSFYKYYRNALENPDNLNEFVEKYNIDCALFFEPSQPLAGAVRWLYNNWNLVYLDDTSVIFLKENKKNQQVIKRYKINIEEYKTVKADNRKPPFLSKTDFYPYGYINKARIFAYLELYDKTKQEAETALWIDKNCIPAYNLLGGLYIMQGEYDDALDVYNQAVKIEPQNDSIYYNLGVLYDLIDKPDSAIDYFKRALKINPKYQSARFGLARSLEKKGILTEARRQLVIIKDKDLSGDINCQLGYIYLKEKKLESAKNSLFEAIKINPEHARAYNGLGIVYGKEGQYELAIEQFKRAIEISPHFKEAHENLAITYANIEKHKKAEPSSEQNILK